MKTHCLFTEELNKPTLQLNTSGESSTKRVILLSLGVMVLEIVCGKLFGSMALLADGWHMGTHVFALGITVIVGAENIEYEHNRITIHHYLPQMWTSKRRENAYGCLPVVL